MKRVPWVDRDRPRLSRRTFLLGSGAAVALPFLEAMWPARASAAPASARRFVAWYVPNGIHMPDWTPAATGASYALTPILAPLANVRSELLVLSGLANQAGYEFGLPGDHARGTGCFLTATRVRRTDGADIQNAISLDQRIANAIGAATSLPSLQLGTESGGSTGDCDSGYSCAYARNISWAGPQSPLAKETNPSSAFDRLFQGPDALLSEAERERRRAQRLSVLDAVTEDATRLRLALGATDRHKLDEYLTGVRALELRVENMNSAQCQVATPGEPSDFPARVRAMADLIVLAFQCDATRVVTFMQANAGSNQTYPDLGVFDGHHQISHHQQNPANHAMLRAIDTWEVGELAYLLERLAAVQEPGGGALLDSSLVFFSSEIEDGDAHRHVNMPIVLAGRGGGTVTPGRHLRFTGNQPVANLFLTILRSFGIEDPTFGDDGTNPLDLA